MSVLSQIETEEIEYPSSDGEPMAESDITRFYMVYSVEALEIYFKNREDVYVSANSFIYSVFKLILNTHAGKMPALQGFWRGFCSDLK